MRDDAKIRIKSNAERGKYSFHPCVDLQHSYRHLGFTLIELVLYIALIAIFITGAVYFTWDISYGKEKAYQQTIVDQNARIAQARISYEIRRAYDVVSILSNQIILDNKGSLTTISHVGDAIEIETNGVGPFDLTSNQARVTNFFFNDLGASSFDPSGCDSKNIEVSMVIEQAQAAPPKQLVAKTQVVQSIELNSAFNQARKFLVDLTNTNLVATSLEGITLKNSSGFDITVDKMTVIWEGASGGENVVEVQIDGEEVEWTGSMPSGSELDLNDYLLTAGSGTVNVDYIDFDSDMGGATIYFSFIFSDLSRANAELVLPPSLTGTPTPTPIPTSTQTPTPTPTVPQNTCSNYCLNTGYLSGTCRKNAKDCTNFGEVYESAGDQYCTGGPSTDTCCCAP